MPITDAGSVWAKRTRCYLSVIRQDFPQWEGSHVSAWKYPERQSRKHNTVAAEDARYRLSYSSSCALHCQVESHSAKRVAAATEILKTLTSVGPHTEPTAISLQLDPELVICTNVKTSLATFLNSFIEIEFMYHTIDPPKHTIQHFKSILQSILGHFPLPQRNSINICSHSAFPILQF